MENIKKKAKNKSRFLFIDGNRKKVNKKILMDETNKKANLIQINSINKGQNKRRKN